MNYFIVSETARHFIVVFVVTAMALGPFIINWWMKRKRPLTRTKHRRDEYFFNYGRRRQPLNIIERILAHLRII